jgi:hypothetical protein
MCPVLVLPVELFVVVLLAFETCSAETVAVVEIVSEPISVT